MANKNADKFLEDVVAEAKMELANLVKEEVQSLVQDLRKGPPQVPPAAGGGPVPPEESPAGPGEGPGDPEPGVGDAPPDDGGDPGADGGGDPGADGGMPNVDEIKAQAMSMPPEIVAVYAQAFQEALDEMQGGGGDPSMGGGPPPGPSAPPSEETAAKSENARLGAALRKAQADIVELSAKVQRLSAKPTQRAYTGNPADGQLAKSEPAKPVLSKDQITEKLLAKSQKPDLSAADRSRINQFYMNPNFGADKIADLLV